MRKKRNKKKQSWSAEESGKKSLKELGEPRHPSGSSKCLVVDGMNIAYQAYYAYSRLSYKGKSTAILFGFLQILRTVLQRYTTDRIIVCWDGVRSKRRLKALPTYKSHREKGRDPKERKKFLKQIDRTKRLIHALGIAQAEHPKLEGDDMIYWVVKRMQILQKVLIISGDKDFKQLVNHDVNIFNPRNQHIDAVFAFDAEHAGIRPIQYVDYQILVGDDSDDIPGYPGIGPVRAGKFLEKFFSIRNYLKSEEDFPGMIDKDGLKKLYKRNRLLMDLKWYNEKYTSKIGIVYYKGEDYPKFNKEKWERICLKYGLRTMITDNWLSLYLKSLHA